MQAGLMRHLIRLQRKVSSPDGQGGFSNDWTDIEEEVHAQVTPAGGAELLFAGQLEYTNTYRVSMRYLDRFTPAQRVIWVDGGTDHILDVQSTQNPDMVHRELVLTCIERIPGPGPVGQ